MKGGDADAPYCGKTCEAKPRGSTAPLLREFFDDYVVGPDFAFFVEEDGGELVGAFGEFGGEGDAGVLVGDWLRFDVLTVETESGLGDGEGLADVGAEGFGGSRDVLTCGKSGVDGVIRFSRPAEGRDLVGAIGDYFDGPVTGVLLLVSVLFVVVGVSSTDVTLVPGRAGVEPIVSGQSGDGVVRVAEVNLGGLGKGGGDVGPPLVVEVAHLGDLLRILFRDVFFLTGVSFDVVEFLAVDEAILGGHDGGRFPFDGIDDALGIGDEEAICPFDIRVGIEEIEERGAIEFDAGGVGDFTGFEEGWDDIDCVAEGVDFPVLIESGVGPVDEHRNAVATIIWRAFFTAHASVEYFVAAGRSIVGGEDEDGVVRDAKIGDELAGGANVSVDITDHAEEGRDVRLLVLVEVHVFLRAVEGSVGGVERDVGKEGLFSSRFFFDEIVSLAEENVGAESFGGYDFAIVEIVAIEVGIIPEVGGLTDAASTVPINFFKAAVLGTVGVVIAEVPFPKHGGGIVIGEVLAEGDFVFADHGAAHDSVPYTGAIGPVSGKKCGAGG